MKRLVAAALGVASIFAVPSPANADSHIIGKWRPEINTICFSAGPGVTENWRLRIVADKWWLRDVNHPEILIKEQCVVERGTVTQVFDESVTWSGWAGITRDSEGYIIKSDILLNMANVDQWKPWPDIFLKRKKHVALHEFGHALGLGHRPDDAYSVMSYGYDWNNEPNEPTASDWKVLTNIYN